MYPRLKLARNLLQDDGVIFISIDDNEQDNLKKLCNEIFGEENFIATSIWERAYSPVNLKKHFSENHDYIFCFAKEINSVVNYGLKRSKEANKRYFNPDNDPRGDWKSSDLSVGPVVIDKVYEIVTPSGRKVLPPSGYCWRLDKDRFEEFKADNRIWFGVDGGAVPSIKRFISEVKETITPMTIWKYLEVGHSQDAKQKLKSLFDEKSFFDYPKPLGLINRCLQLYSKKDSIILDFFAGSATTAHAVMQLNAEDEGSRKCISVQLPEKTDEKSEAFKAGYKNIAEISKERIRRASKKIKEENPDYQGDLGFKVFKLDSSNIKRWEAGFDSLEKDLLDAVDYIKNDRSNDDIVFEILLKYGLDLTLPIETRNIAGKEIHIIGLGALIICLDDGINMEVVNGICALKEELSPEIMRVVFKDNGFKDDVIKTNAITTLRRSGIEDIKSL